MATIIEVRRKAALAGEQFFTAPRRCHYGHEPLRYTASGACVECAKLRSMVNYEYLHEAIVKGRLRLSEKTKEST